MLESSRKTSMQAPIPSIAGAGDYLTDAIAGFIASVILIANIVSFSALMFPGELALGVPVAIFAMLIGSSIGGICISLMTSLPPIATGIDSPTGAVLVLLSTTVCSSVIAAGGDAQTAVQTAMLLFTTATLISGALLYAFGALKWAAYFRFVPYFVVGGFLAVTGWFLVAGGIRMSTGRTSWASFVAPWTAADLAKLASALTVLVILLTLRRWLKSPFAMPAALLAIWVFGGIGLHALGLSGPEHGWYLHSFGSLTTWSPLATARTTQMNWSLLLGQIPELLAVAIVALISLVAKVSSIEVARQTSGDLDREFRSHGAASLLVVPFGGIIASLQIGTSRALEQAGSKTRVSGIIAALILGFVGLASFDLPGLIPLPIVAGLIFYLGYTFFMDGLWRPYAQRAWYDLFLAIGIMLICARYGYLVGVLAGIIGACLLFAVSYARAGVVRRHASRAQFASNVDRSPQALDQLLQSGEAVQIYWLSGYIFFGSSEGLFERIRRDIAALPEQRVAYVILDFGMVAAADSSAMVSLTKLRNFCTKQKITLLYCSVSPAIETAAEINGLFGSKNTHKAFTDLNLALAWCEDRMLDAAKLSVDDSISGFKLWLRGQLGPQVDSAELFAYMEQKSIQAGEVLYREGDPADSIDFVALGSLTVHFRTNDGKNLPMRRMTTHTVVGEMGFYRRAPRSATLSSDGAATFFTLTRSNFERLRSERPDVANAFDDFIIRVLAGRLDLANRTVAALVR
jgi:SulP family sulfate permease